MDHGTDTDQLDGKASTFKERWASHPFADKVCLIGYFSVVIYGIFFHL